jgi:hypothetical protein
LIYQENQQKTGQTYFLIALHTYVDLMDWMRCELLRE